MLFVWACGSLVQIFRLSCSFLHMYRSLNANVVKAEPRVFDILYSIEENCPLKIYVSKDISVPVLAGYCRPAIYLPEFDWTDMEYRYIFLHEHTHWKRKDLIKKGFTNFLCVIMWWNPAVYLIRREVSEIIELNCDRQLTKQLSEQEVFQYLTVLKSSLEKLQYSRIKTNHYTIEFINTAKRYSIQQRFELLTSRDKPSRNSTTPKLILAAIAFLWMYGSYYFILQPNYDASAFSLWKKDSTSKDAVVDISDKGNTFLEEQADGSYILYYGNFSMKVPTEDVDAGLYVYYPIVPYEENSIIQKLFSDLNKFFKHIKGGLS
ncbi:MAG: M56 family metallopeptidase [Eubacteriales bacterium]|nr:M56 family metallopeptidase [Eubacteriales bacterium]